MALPEDDGPTDREGVPPTIRELVQSHRDATGDSFHKLEANSGHPKVNFSYFRKLERGEVKAFPTSRSTFIGIANALGTTELAVVLGFARQLDIPVRMPAFATQVPASVDTIPSAEQRILLQYLRVRSTGETADEVRPVDELPEVSPEEIAQRQLAVGRPASSSRAGKIEHRNLC